MSEKRVCSASRSFAPLIGLFAAPNRPRNAPNSKIPLRKPLFQADSMRLWRIHSAKGAFTLSIDRTRTFTFVVLVAMLHPLWFSFPSKQ